MWSKGTKILAIGAEFENTAIILYPCRESTFARGRLDVSGAKVSGTLAPI